MKFLSVCSGIEAASAAWHPLGWQAVAYSEIEPFPSAVLAHHLPDTPNWGDMTKYKDWPDVSIDLLCGGTPCQSFSVAGLRKGLDDPRGNLMLTFGAIAAKYRPKWLVWENVPGVLSSNGGRDFANFLGLITGQHVDVPADGWGNGGMLSGIASAYGAAYRVLDAQYFGVAQRRRRVFVVGYLGDWRRAAAVLFERHSLSGHPAPSRQARQGITGTFSVRTKGGGGLGTDFECAGGLIPQVAWTMKACKDSGGWSNSADHAAAVYMIPVPHAAISPAIKARDYKGASSDGDGDGAILVPMVPVPAIAFGAHLPAVIYQDSEFGAKAYGTAGTLRAGREPHHQMVLAHAPAIAFGGQMSTVQTDVELSQTLQAKNPQAVAYAIQAGATRTNPASGPDGVGVQADHAYTLEARAEVQCVAVAFVQNSRDEVRLMGGDGGIVGALAAQPGAKQQCYVAQVSSMQVRRLTPRECERLQGFPDGWTDVPHRGKPAADGPRYKAIGNSWAVPCATWIGKRIMEVEAA